MNIKQKMEEAFKIWMFSWMIWHNTKSGKIDYSKLSTDFKVVLDKGEMIVKTTNIPAESEKMTTHLIIATTGVCFTAFDNAFDEVLKKNIIITPTQDLLAAREIVNQIRNAYAHDPMSPKWIVYKDYQKTFDVAELHLKMNFGELNGHDFKVEDVNGMHGIAKLLTYCLNNIKE